MWEISLSKIFIYAFGLISSAVCFINFSKLNNSFRWLGVFLLFSSLSQIIAKILESIINTNVTFYNCATLISVILIYLVFINIKATQKTKSWLKAIFIIGFTITAFFVWNALSKGVFSFRGLASMSFTAALGSLMVLFGMLRNPLIASPLKMGWLWLLMGFLFYYTGTFSYWTAINFVNELHTKLKLQNVNVVLIIIFYLILLIAIIVQLKFGDQNGKQPDSRRRKPKLQGSYLGSSAISEKK